MGFQANDCHQRQVHITMFMVSDQYPISQANERKQQTHQWWLQQVDGNPCWERFTNEIGQEQKRCHEIQREQWHSKLRQMQSTRDRGYSNHKYALYKQ